MELVNLNHLDYQVSIDCEG